ncbi:hypothetical protein KFL_005330040 [Klebsormidium nitens]|uniref:RING-type domain-containing protein n=1 Tax=Klebsormidium nitens TaxID=105231 RepID=A0A1Y1IJB1_KLENI|nr:hypothetical protein KFL_005330040 [Klebsormidium nitens]|eukprot:GAQ89529.1 hypothetical protein KFL_005330040 [Klebsormidium nitens]
MAQWDLKHADTPSRRKPALVSPCASSEKRVRTVGALLGPLQLLQSMSSTWMGPKVQPLECGCCYGSVTHFSSLHCEAGHRLCINCIIKRANGIVFDKESDAAWGLQCFALSESECPKALSLEVLQALLPEPLYEKLRLKCFNQDYPLEKDKRKLTKNVLCPSCKEWWRVGTRATIISTDPILKHFCKSTCIRCKQIWKQGHKCAAQAGAEEGTSERIADAQAGQATQTKRSLKSNACKASIGKRFAGAEKVEKVARRSRRAEGGAQGQSCASEAVWGSGDMSRGPDRSSGSRTEEDELRLQREEALTAAVLSSCPECGVEVDKNNGCNKVHCGNCRTSFCFLCKSVIRRGEGYTHFSVHSTREGTQERCSECGKCKTSSTNKKRKDEKRAEVEKKFQDIEASRASS